MKILIVTAWYHPFIHPRAHRWTVLAEHWAAAGHEIHVVTARRRGCPQEAAINDVQVHRVGFDSLKEVAYYYFGGKNARGRVGTLPQKPKLLTRLTAWLYNAVWKKIYFPDDACIWYFPAKRKVRQLLNQKKFDALITVSLPFTGHLIGLDFSRATAQSHDNSLIWLADIGDPFCIQAKPLNNNLLYGKRSRRLEQKMLESADAVTVTTEFTLKKYREQFGEKAVAKMHVIPPLLHPVPDLSVFEKLPNLHLTSPIKLGYFGALYAPVRTPDAFLDLLDKTFVLRPDLRARIEAHFFGEIFPEFFQRLSTQSAVRMHGLHSRDVVQSAMRQMDILLNIGNTTDFQLPSKAVDYLVAGKPILHLSYTNEDPYIAFFNEVQITEGQVSSENLPQHNLILNLKVENGTVGEGEVQRWLAWLEVGKKAPDETETREKMAPYLVGAVAGHYQALLNKSDTFPKSVTPCVSGADGTPP